MGLNIEAAMQMVAYQHGIDAKKRGRGTNANPYKLRITKEAWLQGWHNG